MRVEADAITTKSEPTEQHRVLPDGTQFLCEDEDFLGQIKPAGAVNGEAEGSCTPVLCNARCHDVWPSTPTIINGKWILPAWWVVFGMKRRPTCRR